MAKSYDDLGHHSAEDACCREHDHCPSTIAPQQCIHGICNNSPFTRSHCDCDAKFRKCLQNLNTEVANTLGALFFNVIQVTCFKERRPCSQWQKYVFPEKSQFDCNRFVHFTYIFPQIYPSYSFFEFLLCYSQGGLRCNLPII